MLALRQHSSTFREGPTSDVCLLHLRRFRLTDQGRVVGLLAPFELREPRKLPTETAKKSLVRSSKLSGRYDDGEFGDGSPEQSFCRSAVERSPDLVDCLNVAIDPLPGFVLGWRAGGRACAACRHARCEHKHERDQLEAVTESGTHTEKATGRTSRRLALSPASS